MINVPLYSRVSNNGKVAIIKRDGKLLIGCWIKGAEKWVRFEIKEQIGEGNISNELNYSHSICFSKLFLVLLYSVSIWCPLY